MLNITSIEHAKEHEYCLRCGRKLKNPIARQLGYGTVCYNKTVQKSHKFKKLF